MTDPPDAPDASDPEPLTRASPATALPKQTIGPYRLLQLVGEGGMGEVWLAEQTRPVHRQVALKVIKAGMDTAQVVARFEAERQALALMDHPAIARVFDAGATPQGRPYFVMEYVRGESITGYVTRRKLSIPDRIDSVHPDLRRRPARPSEGHHSSRSETIEYLGDPPKRSAGAKDYRFWRCEGRDSLTHGAHAAHRVWCAGRNARVHESGAGRDVQRRHRYQDGCLRPRSDPV